MSGPSSFKVAFDFCAASRRACRSALPIAGSSRSMMNLRMDFPSREAAMLSLSRCLRQQKSPPGPQAGAALRGVSPDSAAWPGRSGTQRHRIEDALQVGEAEGLVEEWCRAFLLALAGLKYAAGQGDRGDPACCTIVAQPRPLAAAQHQISQQNVDRSDLQESGRFGT